MKLIKLVSVLRLQKTVFQPKLFESNLQKNKLQHCKGHQKCSSEIALGSTAFYHIILAFSVQSDGGAEEINYPEPICK